MLPKLLWPPSDRMQPDADASTDRKWDGTQFEPVTDEELDDLLTRCERGHFGHAH